MQGDYKQTVELPIHIIVMGMSLDQYRGAIGSFNNVKFILVPATNFCACAAWVSVSNVLITVIVLLLLFSNDIELNPGPRKHYTVGHCNIRGIRAKLSDLRVHLTYQYDIFCISESMLSDNIPNNIIKINGYQIPFRGDRDHNGGGLLTYFSNNMMVKHRNDLESSSIETLWTEVSIRGLKFLVCNSYRPPNSGADFWEMFQGQLDRVKQSKSNIRNVLILGDLNADPNTTPSRFLYSFAQQNHMQIHIDEPTRYTAESRTCLDQIISNMPYLLRNISIKPPIERSDHNVVTAEFNFHVDKNKCYQRKVWYYDKANYDHFRYALSSHDLDTCFSSGNPDTSCIKWTSDFLKIAETSIPNKTATIRPNDVPWYNSHLRKFKKINDRSHSYARKHNTRESWLTYRQNRNKYVNELKGAEEDYYQSMADKLKDGTKTSPKILVANC